MIIFDIGTGSKFSFNTTIDENDTVYCFEPIQELSDKLNKKYSSDNFHIIQKAVSDSNNKTNLNIAGISEHNLSSLLDFSPNAFNSWPGRNDFVITQKIKVETIRLDTFIKQLEKPINKIHYLNLDTNGCDILVLQGMSDYISIVDKGTIMASIIPEAIYLKQNSVKESIDFLTSNNFYITNVEPTDPYNNQAKIYFQKNEIHSA